MRHTISVEVTSETSCRVVVDDGGSRTQHEVIVTAEDVARYAPGRGIEPLVKASFEFLLEREPKESILRRFDLPAIERYFPEYPEEIGKRV